MESVNNPTLTGIDQYRSYSVLELSLADRSVFKFYAPHLDMTPINDKFIPDEIRRPGQRSDFAGE